MTYMGCVMRCMCLTDLLTTAILVLQKIMKIKKSFKMYNEIHNREDECNWTMTNVLTGVFEGQKGIKNHF